MYDMHFVYALRLCFECLSMTAAHTCIIIDF
jgi:hypothetical protein